MDLSVCSAGRWPDGQLEGVPARARSSECGEPRRAWVIPQMSSRGQSVAKERVRSKG